MFSNSTIFWFTVYRRLGWVSMKQYKCRHLSQVGPIKYCQLCHSREFRTSNQFKSITSVQPHNHTCLLWGSWVIKIKLYPKTISHHTFGRILQRWIYSFHVNRTTRQIVSIPIIYPFLSFECIQCLYNHNLIFGELYMEKCVLESRNRSSIQSPLQNFFK